MNAYQRNLSEVENIAFLGSQGSFDGGQASSQGPKDSMSDSSYVDRMTFETGLHRRESELHNIDVSASRGTLVDILMKSGGTMRNNSDNEVLDLAKYYAD
jgi:hypothetical protein